MINYDDFLAVSLECSKEAGENIRNIRATGNINTKFKEDGSPVTDADIVADHVIRSAFTKYFPSLDVISEEMESWNAFNLQDHNLFVLVDPLDGTSGFINGSDQFTINISLVENGFPVIGVLYIPELYLMCWNDSSNIVWEENVSTSVIRKINKFNSSSTDIARIARSIGNFDENTNAYIQSSYVDYSLYEIASSIKFLHLASGNVDVYPRIAPIMLWDIAAGDSIIRALGGGVMHLYERTLLNYKRSTFYTPPFIAAVNTDKVVWPN